MSDEKKLSTSEKLKLWYSLKAPWSKKSELAKATPEKKNYGPWAWVTDGMPKYYPQKALMVVGYVVGACMYFLNEAVVAGRMLLMPKDLFVFNAIGMIGVLLGSAAGIQFIYDSHRGTFDAFKDIWEPWRVFGLEGDMRQDVNRILESQTLWSPEEKRDEEEAAMKEAIPA